MDILHGSDAQLRLTQADGTKYVEFTVDASHDLLIKPSSTGQIKLQPTTDSTDFFQVLDANGGTPVLNVDSTNERVGIGISAPTMELDVVGDAKVSNVITIGGGTPLEGEVLTSTNSDGLATWSAPVPNLRKYWSQWEDFASGDVSSGEIGELGWHKLTAGEGNGTFVYHEPGAAFDNEESRLGIGRIRSGVAGSSNTSAMISTSQSTTGGATNVRHIEGLSALHGLVASASFRLESGTNHAANRWWFGLMNSNHLDIANNNIEGVYFDIYDNNGAGDIRIKATLRNGAGVTVDATPLDLANTTNYHYYEILNVGGNIKFKVDGVTLLSSAGNVPVNGDKLTPVFGAYTSNVAEADATKTPSMYIDYYSLTCPVTR